MADAHPMAHVWMSQEPQFTDVESGVSFRFTTEAKFTECRACLSNKCRQTVETTPGSDPMILHTFVKVKS